MTSAIKYEDKPWLKSYEKGVPEFVDYEEMCMPDILDRSARDFPEMDALIFQGYKITYKGSRRWWIVSRPVLQLLA